MFLKNKYYLTVIVFLLLVSSINAQQGIRDIISPVKIIAGEIDSLIISDLFYSESYDVEIVKHENINAEYQNNNSLLILRADDDFEGITTIDFKLNKNSFSIPVYVKKLITQKFVFRPDKKYKSISVFGSFNNWNRGELFMSDPDKDNIYEKTISLEPGRYEYKFFADGEELLDPSNELTVPNGIGGINSVLELKNPHGSKIFLHKKDLTFKNGFGIFKFYLETEHYQKLDSRSVIALLDNQKVHEKNITIEGSIIEIKIPKSILSKSQMFRIVVSIEGLNSNLQAVPLINSLPRDGKSFDWLDASIYSLMIDRFNNGDKSIDAPVRHDSVLWKANYMGGDFAGITQKIEDGYFDSLGVNTLWLSPVNDNPNGAFKEYPAPRRWYTGYHGYWPISFYDVEEKFGSFDDLKKLISAAHKKKIKILLDFVSHHVHEENPYFKNHRDWFGKLELPDGRLNLRLWDEQRLTTWFEPYLPSFDFINSTEALNFMTDNAIWWLEKTGADGFRHDAVKHVPNIFWRELTKKLKRKIEIPSRKSVYQIGETFGNYELVSSYVNNGQLSAQFNFELYNSAQAVFIDPNRSFKDLDNEMKKTLDVFGPLHLMGNIMDSHDKNRFMAYADAAITLDQWSAIEEGWSNPPEVKDPYSYKKAELYYAYMFSIPGLPVIYYGSEFGMTGLSDPDNRRMMRFGNELNTHEKEMLKNVKKIAKVRNDFKALRYGDFYTLRADEEIYCFIRSDFDQRILVVFNKSDEPKKLEIEIPEFYSIKNAREIILKDQLKVIDNKLNTSLPPRGWKFFELE